MNIKSHRLKGCIVTIISRTGLLNVTQSQSSQQFPKGTPVPSLNKDCTCLPTLLPTYLSSYLPTYLPTYLLTYLPTLPTYPTTYLPTYYLPTLPYYLPIYLPTLLLTCPTYLPTYLKLKARVIWMEF